MLEDFLVIHLTRITNNIMKNYILVLIVLFLSSCVKSYKVSDEGGFSELLCLQTKKDMYLYSTYDLCPIFGEPKRERKFWRLVEINSETQKNLDINNINESRLLKNTRDCNLPSRITVVRLVDKGEKLNIDKVVVRSDAQSEEGLSIYGSVWLNGTTYIFESDVNSGYVKDIKERVYLEFEKCK